MAIVTRRTVKEILNITSDDYNTRIDQFIPIVEEQYLVIRNREWDYDSNDDIEYPYGSEFTASQMIGFLLKQSDFSTSGTYSDKKSESIGSYSYTRGSEKGQMINGYPYWIVGSIERFASLK